MGLFDFLRRKDEKAIPEPGHAGVRGRWSRARRSRTRRACDGRAWLDEHVSRRGRAEQPGIDPGKVERRRASQTIDLRGTGAREEVERVLREHGIDPDKKGQTIDA